MVQKCKRHLWEQCNLGKNSKCPLYGFNPTGGQYNSLGRFATLKNNHKNDKIIGYSDEKEIPYTDTF